MNTIVLEHTDDGDFPIDVYQKLSHDRTLFISEPLNDNLATDIVATLLLKDVEDPTEQITLFINSQGGDIRNALMICDMMNMLKAPIKTVCVGAAMDEALIILASGTNGLRYATKNSVISTSQLVNDWITRSNLTEAEKYMKLATADNKRMMEIIAKTTGKTLKRVNEDFHRRVFLTPAQAVKYKLIDKIVKVNK